MNRSFGLAICTLLVTGLYSGTEQSASANSAFQSNCIPLIQSTPVEIPDDGNWLCVSWVDANAPVNSTVTDVNIKYTLEHPDPSQLEVRLTKGDSNTKQGLWNRGVPAPGTQLGQAAGLASFKGVPSQGEWQLQIRDLVPGQKGRLKAASVHPLYAPSGPLPRVITGTPTRSTALRIPTGAVNSKSPKVDKKESTPSAQNMSPRQPSSWQGIRNENFEGYFPYPLCDETILTYCWTLFGSTTDLAGNPREYLWDDDDLRHHYGWAAWPANAGADGFDPTAASTYPPKMDSWMIYGPFDLSNTTAADVSFWLWRQIEVQYDSFFFGISGDCSTCTYNGWVWDGTADWEEQRFSLDSYLGDSSVWVAWQFSSDISYEYAGPWIDDIAIRKYTPGQVTAQGTLSYIDRDGVTSRPARFTKVHLYDQDPGGTDDELAITTTDANGFFQFPTRTNWDADDTDPDPSNRRLDLYVVWESDYNDSGSARHRVTQFNGQAYTWLSFTSTNTSDGTLDFSSTLPANWVNLEAMWIFQDLHRAWEYVRSNTNPQYDPGSVTALWQRDWNNLGACGGSCFCAGEYGPYIFIAHGNILSSDTVIHETGHHYMYNATQWWLALDVGCYQHSLFSQESANCAWSEGWADFFPLAANSTLNPNDTCYDYGLGPCGGGAFENLETRNRNDNPPLYPWGDGVEARVAGALFDLFDNTNDIPFDSATFGFDPIADIVFQGPLDDTFSKFWDSWKTSGQNKHHALRAIHQNTIDYDTPPRFDPLLPDRTVLQNFSWNHAIDLWA